MKNVIKLVEDRIALLKCRVDKYSKKLTDVKSDTLRSSFIKLKTKAQEELESLQDELSILKDNFK